MILDSNVIIIANNPHTPIDQNLSLDCLEACVDILQDIRNDGIIYIDDEGKILEEYTNNLGFAGAPGLGSAFVKWVFNNQYSLGRVRRVIINESHVTAIDSLVLPHCDPADKKFLHTSHASSIVIIQAADCKWLMWEAKLATVNVNIRFICRDYVDSKLLSKFPEYQPELKP